MSADALLDLSILDAGEQVVAIGRRGSDFAVARLSLEASVIAKLGSFRQRLDRSVRGAKDPLAPSELGDWGDLLFKYVLQGDLKTLYDLLPAGFGRIHILSDQAWIESVPWEYLAFPDRPKGRPVNERSIVRIVPTCGPKAPPAKKLSETVRVLFVSAAPKDQNEVDFETVRGAILRTLQAYKMPDRLVLEAVDGATRTSFLQALNSRSFDVLHFSGHGRVDETGMGQLQLLHRKTGKAEEVSSEELMTVLNGRDLRLVILSACETSSGNFNDDFAVMSLALVKSGIPAVVANQLPVNNSVVGVFVGPLYEELLRSGDIDLAVAKGRGAIDFLAQSYEWGIPTLYRHYAASQIFEP